MVTLYEEAAKAARLMRDGQFGRTAQDDSAIELPARHSAQLTASRLLPILMRKMIFESNLMTDAHRRRARYARWTKRRGLKVGGDERLFASDLSALIWLAI